MQAQTIQEVITSLDSIIEWSRKKPSRMGYFATLYRDMTLAVQKGIQQNIFEDGKRMERLDVLFANRYLTAWNAYVNKGPCTKAWQYAFDAGEKRDYVVLQHLILGINTHINFDLGIAAAETAPGQEIFKLQNDFEKINDIIAELSENMQQALCRVWFPLRAIIKFTRNKEDLVINFSIDKARKAAWANAVALALSEGQAKVNYMNILDLGVVELGKRICNPGLSISFLLRPVLRMENKRIDENMRLLAGA